MAAAEKKVSPEGSADEIDDRSARLQRNSRRMLPDDSPLRNVQTTGKSIIVRNEESGHVDKVNDYNVIKLLGTGSFAEVYLVQQIRADLAVETFAVKCFDKSVLTKRRTFSRAKSGRMVVSTAMDQVAGEVAIMKKLRHPNLVALHEVIDDQEESMMFMVLDYVEGGELMTWDEETGKFTAEGGLFTEDRAARATQDVLCGLEYLHMNHIAHRDLKPENLLVGSDGQIKIADFGVSHFFDKEEGKNAGAGDNSVGQLTKTEGTYYFFAPEMCKKGAFNAYSCDVWAMGVCLWAMVFGTLPFKGGNPVELFDLIQTQELAFPEGHSRSPELLDLLHALLDKDPADRISVEDALEHVWFIKNMMKKTHGQPSARVVVTDDDVKQAIGRRNSQTKSNFLAPEGGTFTKDTRRKMSIIEVPGQTNIWNPANPSKNSVGAGSSLTTIASANSADGQLSAAVEEERESPDAASSRREIPPAASPAAQTAAVEEEVGKKKNDKIVRLSSCSVM